MFKKLKDKIAEEVKSSPQRIQQFAQAAQAAVTSASSSVSDITNNDLFSIGGDDTPQNSPFKGSENASLSVNSFQDVVLSQNPSPGLKQEQLEAALGEGRSSVRRLSNSSAASDVSFRLPSYESPATMFHLQSDMDVSASETEDTRFTPGALDHVSKEQIFTAYKRSQDRYNKYRGRYADLARHYRSLERENAKARAVLVETQDKALRRISELREQCALEKSAKAHLENALRMDLDEKNIKIESLTTKIRLLQSFSSTPDVEKTSQQEVNKDESSEPNTQAETASADNLIDLSGNKSESEIQQLPPTDTTNLEKKVVKYEQLAAKYMEALRSHKEKNAQLTTEIQIISEQLQKTITENEQLQKGIKQLTELREKLQEANESNKDYKSKLDGFEKKKSEDMASLIKDLDSSRNEVKKLHEEINVYNRREEDNAISLAENKLSVHKELEGKEKEIKLLKNNLESASNEMKTFEVISLELQKQISELEDEKKALNISLTESNKKNDIIKSLQCNLDEASSRNQLSEAKLSKTIEEMKRMEMQLKQEVAEKLAMKDRNNYLESRNKQIVDDIMKKNKHIAELEKELLNASKNKDTTDALNENYTSLLQERNDLRNKYDNLESTLKSALENYTLLESKIIECTNVNETLQTNLNEKFSELKKSQLEKNELENRIEQLSSDMKVKLTDAEENLLSVENGIKETLANDMKNRIIELEAKMRESYEAQLAQANISEEQNNQRKIDQMNAVIEAHLEDLRISKVEHEEILNEKNRLQDKIEQYENRLSEAEEKLESFKTLVSEKKALDERLTEYTIQIKSLNTLKVEYEQIVNEKQNLESLVNNLEREKFDMKEKAERIISEVDKLQEEIFNIKKSHNEIVDEKNELESKIYSMENNESDSKLAIVEKNNQLENIKCQWESAKLQIESLSSEKQLLEYQVGKLNLQLKEKDVQLSEFSENNNVWQQKLSTILEDNNHIHEKCERLKQDKEALIEKLQSSDQKFIEFENLTKQFDESKIEKEFLDMRITQLESDLTKLNKEKQEAISMKESLQKELQETITDQKNKVSLLNDNISRLTAEVKSSIEAKNNLEDNLATEIEEKKIIKEELNKLEQMNNEPKSDPEVNVLKTTVTDLLIKLQNQGSENIELQKQVEELKKRHSELEKKCNEIESLQDLNLKLKEEKDEINTRLLKLEKVEDEHKTGLEDLNKIKEERNRLLSDIEGLQAHLTKVSKDNSQLNDKLRDLIANEIVDEKERNGSINASENVDEEIRILHEENTRLSKQSNVEVELRRLLDELEKRNAILLKEKEDLERQLDAPLSRSATITNFAMQNSDRDFEIKQLSGKNKLLVQEKLQLESRIADIELMSRSGDSNLRQIEQKNEKLRLMNEKLERRLDEALVSLRHFRSLEESTELEYLRNILYEYLTGPSTHTVTLAKVISAVVKFDDTQTHLVLQREKERQGLLGQLGLL